MYADLCAKCGLARHFQTLNPAPSLTSHIVEINTSSDMMYVSVQSGCFTEFDMAKPTHAATNPPTTRFPTMVPTAGIFFFILKKKNGANLPAGSDDFNLTCSDVHHYCFDTHCGTLDISASHPESRSCRVLWIYVGIRQIREKNLVSK
jgi:hypothetical protein